MTKDKLFFTVPKKHIQYQKFTDAVQKDNKNRISVVKEFDDRTVFRIDCQGNWNFQWKTTLFLEKNGITVGSDFA